MAANTKIEWADDTWNVINGCMVVSPGCTNCYAMRMAGTRMKNSPSRHGLTREVNGNPVWNGEVRFNERAYREPLSRPNEPRRIFVCAHGDLFYEKVPDEWIDRVFAMMATCPQHVFQVLTKRPERARQYLMTPGRHTAILAAMAVAQNQAIIFDAEKHRWPLPNVWLGTSVEDQKRADERIPVLLTTPAAVRWISAEPLLGPLNLKRFMWPVHPRWPARYKSPADAIADGAEVTYHRQALVMASNVYLDWVVAGGESGPGARPMHPAWARSLRDQCAASGVAFLFKQWGDWLPRCEPIAVDSEYVYMHDGIGTERRWLTPAGGGSSPCDEPADGDELMIRVGKRQAGRLLEKVEHNGYPG